MIPQGTAFQPSMFEEVAPIVFDRRTSICIRCGRFLTDPHSVSIHIGPVCALKKSKENQ